MSRVHKTAAAILALGPVIAGLHVVPVEAALDHEAAAVQATGLELLVVEADNCLYCNLFRREIAATYESSPRARSVPMRFTDIAELDGEGIHLDAPVESVPTIILLKNGREAGRVAGYLGPENFFHFINFLISGAN